MYEYQGRRSSIREEPFCVIPPCIKLRVDRADRIGTLLLRDWDMHAFVVVLREDMLRQDKRPSTDHADTWTGSICVLFSEAARSTIKPLRKKPGRQKGPPAGPSSGYAEPLDARPEVLKPQWIFEGRNHPRSTMSSIGGTSLRLALSLFVMS